MVICLLLTSFAACGEKSDPNTFSWFLYTGNAKYDTGYKKNPGVQWLESKEFAGAKLDLEIMIPPRSSSASETMQTLIASGDYPDIIDSNALTYSPYAAYKEGIIMDLTPYVEKYMPNYMAYLDANPDVKPSAYVDVDGENKMLGLISVSDKAGENCWGFCYRRDWLVKYGKNPFTNEAFTGGYDENRTWNDNVVFPNGSNVPKYLSDWMWMFEIFEIAFTDLGLQDDQNSYCMSIPYSGIDIISGLSGAFNTSPTYYVDGDGKFQYGLKGDNIKVFYEAMNDWYNKGYIDKTFYERSSDAPYSINLAGVSAGKVGIWYAGVAFFADALNNPTSPYLDGAYVMAARPPLNDVYGEGTEAFYDENANPFENRNVYTWSRVDAAKVLLSVNAEKKNLEALFTMFDYMYTTEWAYIRDFGFSIEQQEIMQNELYIELGIESGYLYATDANGNYVYDENGLHKVIYAPKSAADNNLAEAVDGRRLFGMHLNSIRYNDRDEWLELTNKELMSFNTSGYIQATDIEKLKPDESDKYADTNSWTRNEGELIFYKFVTGELDIDNEADWNVWTEKLALRYGNSTATYGEVIDEVIAAFNKTRE